MTSKVFLGIEVAEAILQDLIVENAGDDDEADLDRMELVAEEIGDEYGIEIASFGTHHFVVLDEVEELSRTDMYILGSYEELVEKHGKKLDNVQRFCKKTDLHFYGNPTCIFGTRIFELKHKETDERLKTLGLPLTEPGWGWNELYVSN